MDKQKMHSIAIVLMTLLLSANNAAGADIQAYTDALSFKQAAIVEYLWDFEDVGLSKQWHDYIAPDGSTIMPLVNSNTLTPWTYPLNNLSDKAVYMNPQLDRAFIFEKPVSAFGIFTLWSNYYTQGGVTISAYDEAGSLIGRVHSTEQDAIQSWPIFADKYWYESFIGFVSDVPVASIYFDNEIGGSMQYDNAMLQYAVIPTIEIVGGNDQECSEYGGKLLQLSATVNREDITSIAWLLDDNIIGYGNSINHFVELGSHVISVNVTASNGNTGTGSEVINITDTTPPLINAWFVDSRSGQPIVQIQDKSKVSTSISVSDTCDEAPVYEALTGLPTSGDEVFAIERARKSTSIRVDSATDHVELSITANDASGNAAFKNIELDFIEWQSPQ